MILRVHKSGKSNPIEVVLKLTKFQRPKENDPIGADRVMGVDTESLTVDGVLQTVLTPYSSDEGSVCQSKAIDNTIDPIMTVLDYTMQRFGEVIDDGRLSRVRHRAGKGTRERINPVLWVFYNLEYDLQRLFLSDSKFFTFLRQGRTDLFIELGPYQVQIVNCNPTGSAPSFQIIATDLKTHRTVRIYGMDMWGYWKTGLDKTAKALGVGEKDGDIDKAWFDIPLEQWTDDMWNIFVRYAGKDSELTRGIYLATAELLGSFSGAVYNKMGMLPPSAPAAAARMAFSMASEREWERPPKFCEQLALDAYHGGYVAMLRRGYVENVTFIDLHSAYPSAMLLLPDPCTATCAMIPRGEWTDIPAGYRKVGNLGFVRASFTIKDDAKFPSVSMNHKKYTMHQTGTYENFAISLPELSALFDLGQIDRAVIHTGFLLVGNAENSFLRRFVEWFYEVKENNPKDSPLYLAAKLLINALYGKLIEIHEPTIPAIEHAPDLYENIVMPPNEKPFAHVKDAAQLYVDKGMSALFDWSYENMQAHLKQNSEAQLGFDAHTLTVMEILQDQTSTAGAYFLPIHASLITAMTRAKLAIMLNCFDAIGGDTDSVATDMQPGTDEWKAAEAKANEYAIRAGVGGVADQPGLLGYGVEMIGGQGYIAGIKQYTLKADGYKSKLAHHAITDPPGEYEERKTFCEQAVAQLAQGFSVTYETRKKPRRLRESLLRGDGLYGIFVTRVRTVQPKQDERLKAIHKDEHGTIHYRWRRLDEMC